MRTLCVFLAACGFAGARIDIAAALVYGERMVFECRRGCGACCIAPSISASLPALPQGKAAGERCPHLRSDVTCALFGLPTRPAVCSSLRPGPEMCRDSSAGAMAFLIRLEALTAPRRAG